MHPFKQFPMLQNKPNPLYPIFLKLHELHMLIVGAGMVGYEKLSFILKSSPDAKITIVALWISPDILNLLASSNHHVQIIQKAFHPDDIQEHNLIIAATNDRALNHQVQQTAKAKGKLVNVADTPDLCDFYLGSIVTRGALKVAISTNGQSPTFAKRFRQFLEEMLPEEVDDLINNLKVIRDGLTEDFEGKVKKLNEVTASLVEKEVE